MKLTNWGHYPIAECKLYEPGDLQELTQIGSEQGSFISRGLGRCYGDASLGRAVISTIRLDQFLSFDAQKQVLTCRPGATLGDIINTFLPRGWVLPVIPGTRNVTVAGAIAADIHGKNHRSAGTFCDHVIAFDLLLPSGRQLTCSPTKNTNLFRATCGGMGLTGVITSCQVRLRQVETSLVKKKTYRAKSLEETIKLLNECEDEYSMAWVDSLAPEAKLGRGVVITGSHASKDHLKGKLIQQPLLNRTGQSLTMPRLTSFFLGRATAKIFNSVYYHTHRNSSNTVPIDGFFFPLDRVKNFNDLYGKHGLIQYQCCIPLEHAPEALYLLLQKIQGSRLLSFTCVLKRFGRSNKNLLSFPLEGFSLAVDFKAGKKTREFLGHLDAIVIKYGGRIYLAKDSRMPPSIFQKSYHNLPAFCRLKKKIDPEEKISSHLWQRLKP